MNLISLDKVGVCSSSACAVHCAVMLLVVVNAGTLGVFAFLETALLEWVVLAIALLVGALAIIPSFLKHRKEYILILFFTGVLLIINSEFVELIASKIFLSTLGGALMAYAHYGNLKLRATT